MTNFLNYTPIEIEQLSHESRFEYFPQAIGEIDASIILIQKPNDPIIQKRFYSGKHKCHCLKFQALVSPAGICYHYKGTYDGKRHDLKIFKSSNLTGYFLKRVKSDE